MRGFDDILRPATPSGDALPSATGVVLADAVEGDLVPVSIRSFDGGEYQVDARWSSNAATLPAEGDDAAVVFTDEGEAWIVAWRSLEQGDGGEAGEHTHVAADITDFAAAVQTLIDAVVDGAPGALDTLNELAAALGDDANYAATITTALAGKQPLDADLTAIAGLTPSNDDVVQRKAGAWTNRTMAQLASDLDAAGLATDAALGAYLTTAAAAAAYQPLDADLTTIAALDSGTSAGVMATEAAGWVKRTYAQIKTSLGLVKADVGLGNVDNTSDANKPVSTAQQTALDLKANLAGATFTGDVVIDSAGTATVAVDRAAVTNFASFLARTAGVDKWTFGLRNDSTDDFHFRDNVNARTPLKITQAGAVDLTSAVSASAPTVAIGAGANIATIGAVNTALGAYLTTAAAAAAYQPLDSDLTTIAGLTATTDNFMQAKAGAWESRSVAQVVTDLVTGGLLASATAASTYMPLAGGTGSGTWDLDAATAVLVPTVASATSNTNAASTAFVKAQKIHDFTLPTAATPMNSQKFTGLAAGSAAGDSLRYEQLFTAGTLTLLGPVSIPGDVALTGNAEIQFTSGADFAKIDSQLWQIADLTSGQMEITASSFGFGPSGSIDWLMSRTGVGEVTLGAGDVFKHDTPAPLDNSTKSATTEYVDDAVAAAVLGGGVDAGDVTVTPSGLIVVTTNVASALVKLEQGIDDLREEFEGHYHAQAWASAIPTAAHNHTSIGNWQKVPLDTDATTSAVPQTKGFTLDTANDRLIANEGGIFEVTATVGFTTTGTGQTIGAQVYLNGGQTRSMGIMSPAVGATIPVSSVPTLIVMKPADYVELWAYQNIAASTAVTVNSGQYTILRVRRVA